MNWFEWMDRVTKSYVRCCRPGLGGLEERHQERSAPGDQVRVRPGEGVHGGPPLLQQPVPQGRPGELFTLKTTLTFPKQLFPSLCLFRVEYFIARSFLVSPHVFWIFIRYSFSFYFIISSIKLNTNVFYFILLFKRLPSTLQIILKFDDLYF